MQKKRHVIIKTVPLVQRIMIAHVSEAIGLKAYMLHITA